MHRRVAGVTRSASVDGLRRPCMFFQRSRLLMCGKKSRLWMLFVIGSLFLPTSTCSLKLNPNIDKQQVVNVCRNIPLTCDGVFVIALTFGS